MGKRHENEEGNKAGGDYDAWRERQRVKGFKEKEKRKRREEQGE